MRRKKYMGDFITHITRYPTRVDMQHLISLNIIKGVMERMQEDIGEKYSKSSEIEKLETMAEIKMAYIMLYEAYKKSNPGKEIDEDEMFEKQEIIDIAHQIEERADKDYEDVQKLKRENPRGLNEYRDLGVRNLKPIGEIDLTYIQKLRMLNNDLSRKIQNRNFSEQEIIRYRALLMIIQEAHRNLSDPEYKRKLDEILLLNFTPDQSQKFVSGNFAEITYIPEKKYIKGENGKFHEPQFVAYNSAGDEMIIKQTGDLGFGRFRRKDGDVTYRDPYSLKEYRIIKKYSNPEISKARKDKTKREESKTSWNDEFDGEEFRVYGNMNTELLTSKEDVDPEYVRYNTDVLLSTVNLDEALEHNGGYIGEVYVDQRSREYVVHHDSDRVCLATEFQNYTTAHPEVPENKAICIKLDKKRRRQQTPEER